MEDSYKPCVFLSHLWLPALVSSDFSNCTGDFASSVHCYSAQHRPVDFKAVHSLHPECSRLETSCTAGTGRRFRVHGMEISRCLLSWQPAALANTSNLKHGSPRSRASLASLALAKFTGFGAHLCISHSPCCYGPLPPFILCLLCSLARCLRTVQ